MEKTKYGEILCNFKSLSKFMKRRSWKHPIPGEGISYHHVFLPYYRMIHSKQTKIAFSPKIIKFRAPARRLFKQGAEHTLTKHFRTTRFPNSMAHFYQHNGRTKSSNIISYTFYIHKVHTNTRKCSSNKFFARNVHLLLSRPPPLLCGLLGGRGFFLLGLRWNR